LVRLSAFSFADWRPFNKVDQELSSGNLNLAILGRVVLANALPGTFVPLEA
jgi:hypothetical protein